MAKPKRYICPRWPFHQVGSHANILIRFESGEYVTADRAEQKFIEDLPAFGIQILLEEPPEVKGEAPDEEENVGGERTLPLDTSNRAGGGN